MKNIVNTYLRKIITQKKKRTKKNLDKKFFNIYNIYNKFLFFININKHL